MSNIFKLYPTHFSRGGKKLSRGDSPPWLQALWLAEVVFSYFVLYSSKIPLVPATKVTPLCSLLFRQPDGVNCVVRRVYLAIIA